MPIASSWHQNICIDRGTLMKHHSYRFNFHSSEVLRNHPYLHHDFFFFFEAQNCIPLHTVQSIVKWNLQMTLTMVGHGSQHPNSWHLTRGPISYYQATSELNDRQRRTSNNIGGQGMKQLTTKWIKSKVRVIVRPWRLVGSQRVQETGEAHFLGLFEPGKHHPNFDLESLCQWQENMSQVDMNSPRVLGKRE